MAQSAGEEKEKDRLAAGGKRWTKNEGRISAFGVPGQRFNDSTTQHQSTNTFSVCVPARTT